MDATQTSNVILRTGARNPGGPLRLAAPPTTGRGKPAVAAADRLNGVRNSLRIAAEAHMITAPLLALAGGLLAGCVLRVALRRRPRTPPVPR